MYDKKDMKTFYMQQKNGQIRKIKASSEEEAAEIAKSIDPQFLHVGELDRYVKITNKEMKQVYKDVAENMPAILSAYMFSKRKKK